MKASEIIKLLGKEPEFLTGEDFPVKGISIDSRKVVPDSCFVAIEGVHADGHDFIEQVFLRGARIIIYNISKQEKISLLKNNQQIVCVGVDNTRKVLGMLAAEFFGQPARKLKMIGITGTNGKTTTSFLIENMLKNCGFKSGVIGTIYYKIEDKFIKAHNTTPDAITLNSLFLEMVQKKLTHAVMEVSSHALDQQRIGGIGFNIALFTNLTHDHLDYHRDIEDYFSAKAKLFTELDKSGYALINGDDEYGKRLKTMTRAKVIDYAIIDRQAAVRAENIQLTAQGTSFTVVTLPGSGYVKTKLIGKHNIYNILGCICVGLCQGIELQSICDTMSKAETVPGRLEQISSAEPFEVFIDYAHTDDALKNVLSALREIKPKKIITVFGCGGDRDKKKRPLMGKIASRMSDFVIITNDNPRTEEPEEIISHIKNGFDREFENYKVIPDRKQAIKEAVHKAEAGDFVLIAGKGHETYQIFKDKTIDFDDRKVVREILDSVHRI
ncbi:MAG: UDP-N-acetylmuramoyl-L-alanyl-D-glutamate--2,6-diaminopimelate ligase [Candidatus Omnitrophota bacterium]